MVGHDSTKSTNGKTGTGSIPGVNTNNLSKQAQATILAFQYGYRVDKYGVLKNPRGNIRQMTRDTYGYYKFSVRLPGSRTTRPVQVSKLQAYQLYGIKALLPNTHVRHLNEDKNDNRPENIGIGSCHDNMMDRSPEKRKRIAIAGARSRRLLSDDQLCKLRMDRESGMSYRQLCLKYGIWKSTVSGIVTGRLYGE